LPTSAYLLKNQRFFAQPSPAVLNPGINKSYNLQTFSENHIRERFMSYRIETPAGAADSMGEIQVPEDRYYGAQTAWPLIHFKSGGKRMPRELSE
jgi:hypothetical protein